MSTSQIDPHDKMRARDVNKVARGEQAPRPAHEYGTVSQPPITKFKIKNQQDDHNNNDNKDQIEKWNKERELGTFPGPV